MKKKELTTKNPLVSIGFILCVALLFIPPSLSLAREKPNQAGTEYSPSLHLERISKGFAYVVKKAGPAVVHVSVEKYRQRGATRTLDPFNFFNDPFFERFFGPNFRIPEQKQKPRTFKQRAAGSGFIISQDGYILTNNHVIRNANKITVRLADEREFQAEVIGTDPQSDVALIKIDGKNLPILPLGDSDAIHVGEWAIAIGSPFELKQTVTVGVISAKGRNRIGISDYENFIQTDAAINPGNSGGPLLNIHGEAIGINTAIFTRSGGHMGIGFAIPVNMAKVIVKQLQEYGKVTRGWLGVGIQDIDKDLAEFFGLDSTRGVLITGISEGSPADKSGLKDGDVIIAINGKQTKGVAELRNIIAMIIPGTKSSLQIIRDREEKTIKITIGEQPPDFASTAKGAADKGILSKMGLNLQDLTPALAKKFGYENNQGVLIADVARDSQAAKANIRPGTLIEEVNKIRVHNLKELNMVLEKSENQNQVLLRIRHGEHSRFIVLRNE